MDKSRIEYGDAGFWDSADSSFGEVHLGQALDFLNEEGVEKVLKKAVSVLESGGLLFLLVTDFDWLLDGYRTGSLDPETVLVRNGELLRSLWNRGKLADTLNLHGLEVLGGYSADGSVVAKWEHSPGLIGVVARKRNRKQWPAVAAEEVHAIMSLPRLGWTETFGGVVESVHALGIPFSKVTGVFWGQCLERLMTTISESRRAPKYILTIDYDSVFEPRDIVRLWQVMEDNPDVAALCPLQIGRERDSVLCNFTDRNGAPYSHMPVEHLHNDACDISSGHFGLTLIRTEALVKMADKHPWFLGVPNEHGRWDENRTDDDIYFWHKVRGTGMRICACPKVRLGHLQMIISWPNDELKCVNQYLGAYHKDGRPTQCHTY